MQREVSIMSEPLITYLHDHLGGAQLAIQLLEGMRDQHDDPTFRDLTSALLPEIQADDAMLRSIAEKIGASPSVIKQAGGWLVEKFARVKLGHTGSTNFEMFESLELLALGIHGKLILWKALRAASELDSRLRQFDFEELVSRAQQQYDKVETHRLNLAETVLSSPAEKITLRNSKGFKFRPTTCSCENSWLLSAESN
jgi:hypothetical protein